MWKPKGSEGERERERAVAKLTVNNQVRGQTGNVSLVVQNANWRSRVSSEVNFMHKGIQFVNVH